MKLNELRDNPGARKTSKRVGRGVGSGKGKTSGSGHKGAKARSGVAINGFEGGQMPLYRRLPKRGFNNIFRKDYVELTLGRIQAALDSGKIKKGESHDVASLVAAGVLRRAKDGVRIIASGELKDAVTIKAAGASKAAQEAVKKAGGEIQLPAVAAE
ncbi:MAG: 50S ribosomal protein L15 [Alphaproteobacteria bacterium]